MNKKLVFLLLIIILVGSGCIHPPISLESHNAAATSPKDQILSELTQNVQTVSSPISNSVGVLTFKDKGANTGLGLAATEFFTANLALFDDFTLIDMSYTSILEQEFDRFSPAKKQQALRAEQLVTGAVSFDEEELKVYGLILDPETKKYEPLAMYKGGEKDFFRLVADLNIKYLKEKGITVSRSIAEQMYKVPTENIEAYVLYAKGRRAERRGDYNTAKAAYQKASEMDSEFEEPQISMERVENVLTRSTILPVTQVTAEQDLFTREVNQLPGIEEKSVPATSSTGKVVIDIYLPQTTTPNKN